NLSRGSRLVPSSRPTSPTSPLRPPAAGPGATSRSACASTVLAVRMAEPPRVEVKSAAAPGGAAGTIDRRPLSASAASPATRSRPPAIVPLACGAGHDLVKELLDHSSGSDRLSAALTALRPPGGQRRRRPTRAGLLGDHLASAGPGPARDSAGAA